MSERVVHENQVFAWFLVGGIAHASLAEVTEGEINAATKLGELTVDGLGSNPTRNNASIAMMEGGFTSQRPGTRSNVITLRHARNKDGDAMWDLWEYGLAGDLIVHRFGGEPEVGAPLEVYRVQAHDPDPIASAENTYQQFEVELPVDRQEKKAELVAGS
jgi:hypothetical protein